MSRQSSGLLVRIGRAATSKGPLRAFAYGQFRVMWIASLFSIIAFFVMLISRGWLILELTDSPFMVTAINAVPMLPLAFVSPFGGAIADRLNRRVILLTADGFTLVILLALAALVFADVVEVWHVFALSLLHGVAFAGSMPARAAMVPDLVATRDLSSGVALFTTIFSTGQLAGPAPAGFLVGAFGMGFTFLAASLMLVPAVGFLFLLQMPDSASTGAHGPRESVPRSIWGGMTYIARRPLLIGLILMGLVFAVFGLPFQALLPVIARDVLAAGPEGLGILGGAVGAGAVTGSIVVASLSSPSQVRFLMIGGGLGFGVLIVFFAFSTVMALSVVLTFLLGLMMQTTMTSNFTIVQVTVPNEFRGRVLSLRMIAVGMGPVGMLGLGASAEMIGTGVALALFGAAATLLTLLVVLAFRDLRKTDLVASTEGTEETPSEPGASSGTVRAAD